jgi:hypothetical protein
MMRLGVARDGKFYTRGTERGTGIADPPPRPVLPFMSAAGPPEETLPDLGPMA